MQLFVDNPPNIFDSDASTFINQCQWTKFESNAFTCASNTLTCHMVLITQSFIFPNLECVVIENESTYMYSIVDHNVDFLYGIHEMKTLVS